MHLINCCIISTDEEILDYENCLYEAFVVRGKNFNFWVKSRYIKSGEKRIKPNIPYKDLLIFAIKNDNKIIAARVFNMNMEHTQIRMTGFKIILNKECSCEAIHLFCLEDRSIESAIIIKKLNRFIKNYLYDIGIKKIYGVCIGKHIKMYKALGMRIIDKKISNIICGYVLEQDIVPSDKSTYELIKR
jgi:hypothetical protein